MDCYRECSERKLSNNSHEYGEPILPRKCLDLNSKLLEKHSYKYKMHYFTGFICITALIIGTESQTCNVSFPLTC